MNSKLGLKERIYKYFKGRPDVWVASGEIQRLTMANTDHTARSAVRRMQELTEDGKLTRELRKGHSFYRLAQTTKVESPHCAACAQNTINVANW